VEVVLVKTKDGETPFTSNMIQVTVDD